MKKENIVKSYCGECGHNTNQYIISFVDNSGSIDELDIQFWSYYQTIKCLGCDCISFRHVSTSTEDYNPNTGDLEETIKLYPDSENSLTPMDHSYELPPKIRNIYFEVLTGLSHDCPLLSAIGLRALVEAVCKDQNTKAVTLHKSIDELAHSGKLSKDQANFFHRHRFMGNIAAHEVNPPNKEQLQKALDIVETLLKTIYILPNLAKSL